MSCTPHPLSANFILFTESGTTDHLQEVWSLGEPIATLMPSRCVHITQSDLEHILFLSLGNASSKAARVQAGKLNSGESFEQKKQAKETECKSSQLSQVQEHSLWAYIQVNSKLIPCLF